MATLGFGTAFAQPGGGPPAGGSVDYELSFTPGSFDSEASYELVPTLGGAAVRSVACGSFDATLIDTVTLAEGVSYDFNAYDDYGDGWNGGAYTITRIPCDDVVNSESPSNGAAGDGSYDCIGADLESTFTFVAAACPTCPNPTDVVAIGTGATTATLTWTTGGALFHAYEYGPAGFTPNNEEGVQVGPASSPSMMTDLTAGTIYDVYLVGICSVTEPLELSEAQMTSFTTSIANEACETAISIAVADDTTIVINGSTLDGPAIDCSLGAEDDAWLMFVGTGAPVIVYGSVQGPVTDFAMEIWDGCPSLGGTLISCDDDGNDTPSNLMPLDQICTVEGQEYFIRVWGYGISELGSVMGITVKEVRPMITGNSNVGDHGMTINFSGYEGGEKQIIRVHPFGESGSFMWKTLPATANSGYKNNLEPHTRYTVRVGTRCPGENAAYGDTATFWTKAMPCVTPVPSEEVDGNVAFISWSSTGADSYKIRYRLVGGSSWTWVNTTDDYAVLSDLLIEMTYEYQIRSLCDAGGNQSYGLINTFSTFEEFGRLASKESLSVSKFNLYPNPTNGAVTVVFNSTVSENITFNVTDLSGKLVMSNTVAANEGSNRVYMEMSDLEAGVYLTTLSTENGISERVRVILK